MVSNPSDADGVAKEFDSYSRTYDTTVDQALGFTGLKVDFFTRVKADYLLDIVNREVGQPSDCTILDVGCGVGNYHAQLQGSFRQIIGIDISHESIKVAAERFGTIDYRHYNGTELPLEDASVDVVFAICVYHHVPIADRMPLTKDVRRVLRPGGIFVIFEHNPRNPLTMRVVNNCPFDADAVLLRPAETSTLMREAGFADVRVRHILTVPAAGRALRTLDRAFSALPLGAQFYCLGRR